MARMKGSGRWTENKREEGRGMQRMKRQIAT
jgi:hypothetical protein